MDLVLYSAYGSNSSQRVEWAIAYKGIPCRIETVESPKNEPYGFVPSLSIDGQLIAESMAILEYLEEVFTDRPLLPVGSLERALVREVCEFVNSTIHPAQNRTVLKFWRPELSEIEKRTLRAQWISSCLQKLKARLFQSSGFAVGSSFSMADIFVATIYRKALSHGSERDSTYESHWTKMIGIPGSENVV